MIEYSTQGINGQPIHPITMCNCNMQNEKSIGNLEYGRGQGEQKFKLLNIR